MKSKSRNYPVFLFLLASTMMLSCGGGDLNVGFGGGVFLPPVNTDFTAQESFSSEVEVVNQTLFNLTGKNGEITITGRSGVSSVMITAIKRIRSDSTQDAKEHLQGLEVEVQDLANEVRVETVQPRDTGGRKYEVDYTIILPSFFEIRVSNVNGSVTINSIENDVTVNNTNGSVTLVEIVGSALVNLTSGIIESDVTLPLNGKIDLNTVNGNVALSIPVSTSAEFSAVVTNGNISVENLVLQNEVTTSTSRLGTLGSGQGTIDLTTGNGNIRVRGL